ncbi:hypothetical protein Dimus_002830, partial [Dionaea muscipula]
GRRRDDDEAPAETVENVEGNEGEEVQQDFDWEQVEEDAEIRGKNKLKRKLKFRGNQERKGLQWNIHDHGVDPSGHLPNYELIHLKDEFARALQANFRFQEPYRKMKSTPLPSSPKP